MPGSSTTKNRYPPAGIVDHKSRDPPAGIVGHKELPPPSTPVAVAAPSRRRAEARGGVRRREEACGGVRRRAEACGGVRRHAEAWGGVQRRAEACGGVRRCELVWGVSCGSMVMCGEGRDGRVVQSSSPGDNPGGQQAGRVGVVGGNQSTPRA